MAPRPGDTEEADVVRTYRHTISDHPLLTATEERTLADGIHDADPVVAVAARRRFIQANLRLVVTLAEQIEDAAAPLMDLIQAGNVGLMQAIDTFRNTDGSTFAEHATPRIRKAFGRVVDNISPNRVPAATKQLWDELDDDADGFAPPEFDEALPLWPDRVRENEARALGRLRHPCLAGSWSGDEQQRRPA